MSENKIPNLVDKHVGRRLRWRRRELNYSQEKLGELLGLTFQQVQKYEKGVNRISAGRLYEIAKVLETSIAYFYQGISESDAREAGVSEGEGSVYAGEIDRDTLDLVAVFQSIPDPALRQSILAMVRNAAESFSSEDGADSSEG